MNPDSRNFDSLRQLLKLKRHEQPPPGYFNRFSRDVMARIKAGETGNKMEPAWFQRVLGMFDVKPVFAGAFGMGVCALLVSGVISSEPAAGPVAVTNSSDGSQPSFAVESSAAAPAAQDVSFTLTDTNPVVQNISLFDQYQPQIQTKPADIDYWIRSGN